MATMTIEIPEGKKAEWVDGVLTLIDYKPKDISERIKTFEDAYEWCKDNNHSRLVTEYNTACRNLPKWELSKDIEAYLKLRIITTALNEGWEPTFDTKQQRWYICAHANDMNDISVQCKMTCLNYQESSRLLFKSRQLAEYAATQFKDIYMDFCKGKN